MRKSSTCCALSLICSPGVATSKIVRLEVGQPLARMALVRPGVHRYARYTVKSDGARTPIDIWERRATLEDNGRRLHFVQRWDGGDSKPVLVQDSNFDARTFAPTTHIRKVFRDGRWTFGGYRFAKGKVVGMAELPDNARKDFAMAMPDASYNFEYDMELLQALPLADGTTFDIPFYDAGIDKKPDRYAFTVAGSDTIIGWDGAKIDCWLVTADYKTGKVVSRFWFAKKTQIMVREEQVQSDGSNLVKALLPPEAADVPASLNRGSS